MKNITNRFMLCAAGALLMSGAAWAQNLMTADVPFAFQFGGVSLPAGHYKIDDLRSPGSIKVVTIQNNETKKASMSIGIPESAGRTTVGNPRLVFRCGDSGCALQQVWLPDAAYSYSVPKATGHQYSASIALTRVQAD